MNKLMNKKGAILHQVVIHILLIALLLSLFVVGMNSKVDNRGVKQKAIEKDIVLMIDSAKPGMVFSIDRVTKGAVINDVRLENGRVYVDLNGLVSFEGYSYFTRYEVSVSEEANKFVIKVK